MLHGQSQIEKQHYRKLSAQNPEPFFEKRWSLINTPYFFVQPQENEDICFPDLQNKEDLTPLNSYFESIGGDP